MIWVTGSGGVRIAAMISIATMACLLNFPRVLGETIPSPGEDHDGEGKLKGHAEEQDERAKKARVAADAPASVYRSGFEASEEHQSWFEHYEPSECGTRREKKQTRQHNGQEAPFFVPVEPGSDESPYLDENHGGRSDDSR